MYIQSVRELLLLVSIFSQATKWAQCQIIGHMYHMGLENDDDPLSSPLSVGGDIL